MQNILKTILRVYKEDGLRQKQRKLKKIIF
jgi:hypothetical protein